MFITLSLGTHRLVETLMYFRHHLQKLTDSMDFDNSSCGDNTEEIYGTRKQNETVVADVENEDDVIEDFDDD